MKIAVIHEWLENYAGSERVLESILELFPAADLFALVDFVKPNERAFLKGRTVRTSFIQRLPFARKRFRNYLGLMPLAVEQFELAGYDLVISSNHAVAKGAITGPDQTHICYVHSPMRYAWDLQAQYLRQSGLNRGFKGAYARWLLHRLRNWDVRCSTGVDVFVGNSTYIGNRIRKAYRRESTILHPPVDVNRFTPSKKPRNEARDTYLVASRFVPYKRIDLIAQAFATMPDCKLLIVGDGPERDSVWRAASASPNITLMDSVDQPTLISLMQGARAFVYAAEEDFGITMVEAQACGTPLIAFGRGGSCDIIDTASDQATGILFPEQTIASIVQAVRAFEALDRPITPAECRANALRFSTAVFQAGFLAIVEKALHQRSIKTGPVARANTLIDDHASTAIFSLPVYGEAPIIIGHHSDRR